MPIPIESIIPNQTGDEAGSAENNPDLAIVDSVVGAALKNIMRAKTGIEKQRDHAKEARKFMAGHHYSEEDLAFLQSTLKPSAAFNVAQKFIRAISGLERRSREHIDFIPTEITNTQMGVVGDFVAQAYEWVMNKCHGDDERSRAFQDKLVDGMGWSEVRLDTTRDASGLIVLQRIDMMEMLWDVNARQDNAMDKEWCARIRLVPFDEALMRWPDKEDVLVMMKGGAGAVGGKEDTKVDLYNWAVGMSQLGGPQPSADTMGERAIKDMIPVIDYQWRAFEDGYFFYDPLERDDLWLNERKFNDYKRRLEKLGLPPIIESTRQIKPRYRRILFTGKQRLIDPVDLPGERFTYNAMTGSWDDEEQLWYGFMWLLMDPQRFANKFLNQSLEIMKTQSKGGVYYESDAVQNPLTFESQYARTGAAIALRPGGIAKIKEKTLPQMPTASIQLLEFCVNMLQEVTGVGPDIFGISAGDTPTGTTNARSRAGYALLASEFSSLRMYRREEALTILDFFQFISDGRLIRVGGPMTAQLLPLIKDPFLVRYDILLEESDSDPQIKQRYWEAIVGIAPMLVRTNQFLPELLDFAPLPRRVIERLKQAMQEKQQKDEQMRAQGMDPTGKGKQDSPEMKQAKIQKLNADTALIAMKTQAIGKNLKISGADAMLKVIIAQEQARQAKADITLKNQQAQQAAQHQAHQAMQSEGDQDLKRAGMANDLLSTLSGAFPQPQQGGQ